ncbi:hypothetical protein NKH77_41030 [Streptomyces sp. M19]
MEQHRLRPADRPAPYRHHAFELHFGLTDSAGEAKPQLRELKEFADTLRAVDFGHCARAATDTALLVSSYLDTPYPSPGPRTAPTCTGPGARRGRGPARRRAARGGARERRRRAARGRTAVAGPSTKQLLAPTWYELERRARAGATVYVSYSPGAHDEQRGPWYAHLNALFGVTHQLEYGLVDPIEDDEVVFTLRRAFGNLPSGATLRFRAAGSAGGRAFLPVEPDGAEVLAVDGHGRPALLLRETGAGSVVFCTYPIEYMAAVTRASTRRRPAPCTTPSPPTPGCGAR